MKGQSVPVVLAALLWTLAFAHAQTPATVQIVATDPATPIELSGREPLYVRISYDSATPIRFQASGLLADSEVVESAEMNPAPPYPAGQGEAIAWIAYRDPTRIDEVRIRVFDGDWKEQDSISQELEASWSGVASSRRTSAAWAIEMTASQQQMVSTASLSSSGDGGAWFTALFMFAAWSVPGYWILQIYAWRRYRDAWRKWALFPLWVTVPLLAYTLFALMAGSNLWPLMMIFITPFAFIYLVAVVVVRMRRERYRSQLG